jgi:hypothetical protein
MTSITTGGHLNNINLPKCADQKSSALGKDLILGKGDVVESLKT